MNQKYILDRKKVIKFILTFACIILIIYLSFKSIRYLAPFILAFIIASIMEPLVRFLTGKTRIPRKVISAVTVIAVMILLGLILYLAISKILNEVRDLMYYTPHLIKELYRNLDLINNGKANLIGLPDEMTKFIRDGFIGLFDSTENILNKVFRAIFNYAFSLPSTLVFIIITILSTYFISSGKEEFRSLLKCKIPEDLYRNFSGMKNGVFSSLVKLLTAYMIIMSITFTELLIGLSVIGIKYSVVLAFAICIIDILPVLGTGTILIPWSSYELITGNTRLGVYIFILYIVILVVRQIIEPKIVGYQIGVHPLISLISIYVGLKLLGAVGLILGPIIMIIIKNTYSIIYKDKSIQDIFFRLKDDNEMN